MRARPSEASSVACQRCGRPTVVRRARSSRTGPPFLGCSDFPRCRATRDLVTTVGAVARYGAAARAVSCPQVPERLSGSPSRSASKIYLRRHGGWVEDRQGRLLKAAAMAPVAAFFVYAIVSRSSPALGS